MLKLGRVTKVKVFFLLLVYVDLFEFYLNFRPAILDKGLLEEFVFSFISTEVNKLTSIFQYS